MSCYSNFIIVVCLFIRNRTIHFIQDIANRKTINLYVLLHYKFIVCYICLMGLYWTNIVCILTFLHSLLYILICLLVYKLLLENTYKIYNLFYYTIYIYELVEAIIFQYFFFFFKSIIPICVCFYGMQKLCEG